MCDGGTQNDTGRLVAAIKILWKKPKRWQLALFCVLWGILIAFIMRQILNLR
jgi:hypothetical protein